ncbi:unnamed protein product [Rotaria socialis]|uniref:Histone acetyltransferase n=1 Tax=Rotaria socialis TaxID=392032 RepID=A0A817US36_9BILA|nr:unnamed protein product [Rotaria socialis]CAF3330355.1 unnamed protein product [Rotaria socialis]CAF3358106.1 unnamed protein product [Rotaria socialis]CAF3605775.1 unnamed protein product [Rotaria socialis]CAF3759156.1 unnamed protein product [Rotaria socialis]
MSNDASKINNTSTTNKARPWIQTGRYEFETVCRSTLCPKEWLQVEKIYVCEYCLKTTIQGTSARRHHTKCTQTRPPGCLIYTQKDVSIFEVCGWKAKTYCEDLCLIATLFIESKIEIKNVHRFRFYVLTVCHNDNQYEFAGFFSKLQYQERLNVSCLLILPPYRNRGFGSLMVHISYALSRLANIHTGTPERPLSTQGLLCYRKYWKSKIFDYLLTKTNEEQIAINDISKATSIFTCDIIETLASLNMIRMLEKDKLIIYRSQELFDEYKQKSKETDIRHEIVNFDSRCLTAKSIPAPLPFEHKCKRIKFDDNETVMTFFNYYPSASIEGID